MPAVDILGAYSFSNLESSLAFRPTNRRYLTTIYLLRSWAYRKIFEKQRRMIPWKVVWKYSLITYVCNRIAFSTRLINENSG